MNDVTIGIVITCFNCVEYTIAAVNSIRTTFNYHLIIVDDFSTDGTKAWLKELKTQYNETHASNWQGFSILTDEPTDSLGEKWNMGLSIAHNNGCSAALVCNNDILFSPETIDAVVNRWLVAKENEERVAVVSAHNLRGSMPNPLDILDFKVTYKPTEAESPDFSCWLVDIPVWEEVGKVDQNYKPCYFEDGDFHATLAIHNYIGIATTAAPYYHYGSRTQNSVPGGLCKSQQFEKLRDYFRAKWGCVPGEQKYDDLVHRKIKVTL